MLSGELYNPLHTSSETKDIDGKCRKKLYEVEHPHFPEVIEGDRK
jgi:hypothetical protein